MRKRAAHSCQLAAAAVAIVALTAGVASAATPPTATTGTASQISYQSAALDGGANPEGTATEVYFEYGTSKAYGSTSAPIPLAAGKATEAVTATVTGLAAFTKYDYRLVAVNTNGTVYGANATFTTLKIPLSLQIAATPDPITYGGLLTVAGTLSGTGNGNRAVALQQNPYPYTGTFTQVGNSELTSATGAYSFTVPALEASTQYRVVTVAAPSVISSVVSVTDSLQVTIHTRGLGKRGHLATRFTGTVAPGTETDVKYAIQELFGTTWRLVGGGITANTTQNGLAHFSTVLHFKRAGFFRVFVGAVGGANAESFSAPVAVRGYA
ncbi:MAG: hypothetical protein ABSC56_08180 [Solirubrobacteraceae bacterium]|jgi:hypothetical protein